MAAFNDVDEKPAMVQIERSSTIDSTIDKEAGVKIIQNDFPISQQRIKQEKKLLLKQDLLILPLLSGCIFFEYLVSCSSRLSTFEPQSLT
jgi:hypothetical protein